MNCNTCLKLLYCENDYFTLEDETNDFISMRSKLLFCVPEMDLEVFEHSVICISCSEVLNLAYDFKNNCLQSGQKVRDYKQAKEGQNSVLMNLSSETYEEEDSKIGIKQTDLEELYVPVANNEPSVLINLSEVVYKEEDYKIDIEQPDFEEPCLPLADMVKNEDLPLTTVESSSLQCRLSQDNTPSLPESCHEAPYQDDALKQNVAVESKYQCGICQENFSLKTILRRHMLIHSNRTPIHCSDCQKDFYSKRSLNCHVCHAGEKPFCCNICQKKFKQKAHLTSHITVHTGEKPFRCNICPKSFRINKNLKTHILSHTGEKPFACDVCPKSFASNQNLRLHIMSHTGENPFCCNICQKSFRHKSSLTGHLTVHTGDKPFSCKICQKSFRIKQNLRSHFVIHSDEKPFHCSICQKSFKLKKILNRHIMTHTV